MNQRNLVRLAIVLCAAAALATNCSCPPRPRALVLFDASSPVCVNQPLFNSTTVTWQVRRAGHSCIRILLGDVILLSENIGVNLASGSRCGDDEYQGSASIPLSNILIGSSSSVTIVCEVFEVINADTGTPSDLVVDTNTATVQIDRDCPDPGLIGR